MFLRTAAPCRVLIADADERRRGALLRLLRDAGYEGVEARDGAEAVGLLRAGTADAALLHSRLPDRNTLEILEECQALPRAVPVLLLAAPGSIHEALQAMQHGVRNYLTGPLTGPELSTALREALQNGPPAPAAPPPAPDGDALHAHKLEALGRLTGGVAHDFNNLLTVLTGYAELLQGALPAAHPARSYADEIGKAVRQGTDVMQRLLAFTRKHAPRPAVVDLNLLVAGVARMLRPLFAEHVELRLELAAEGCPVKVDPGQFEQVLVNLAVNARDAMPGGGRLTVRTARVDAPPAGAPAADGWILVAVSDTGTGMDEPTRRRLFEPFFTTKEPGKGTGLGLATVHGIVQQYGGRVVVQSEPGLGTTFNVYLPQEPEPTPAPALLVPASPLPRGTETVLVLEDEDGVRDLLRRILEGQGYQVLAARDGAEAHRLADGHGGPIHLLLADVGLPGTPGDEVARRLGQRRPGLRVLYISGYGDLPPPQAAAGAEVLAKPFTADTLARWVRAALDQDV
jgi:signal transduction histidine kinase